MKKSDYDNKIMEFAYQGGGFIPYNQNAIEFSHQLGIGEIIPMVEISDRDIKFHRCYFLLLNFIWGYMPINFKNTIHQDKFYYWLKHLKGEYAVIFEFKDGTKQVEYDSIAFGKMSQKSFEDYIREQLPWIYENVVGVFYKGEKYDTIIQTIEDQFEKFLAKLK